MYRSLVQLCAAGAVALLLAACRGHAPRAPVIGQAYVGPVVLKIRSDIPLESSTVATVKHGERLDVLQRRRRFLRVRTPLGAEGWTDERQLLAADDMASLKELSERAAKLPSQGIATTYSDLNVHTQPDRGSPSFLQVKQKEKIDVLAHVVTPRKEMPRKPLFPPAPKKQKGAPKKPAKEPRVPPPPLPKPPAPPADWLELSKTDLSEDGPPEEEPEKDEKPVPVDDWSLVRTPGGQSGWALTRRLVMAIPDEVAQYAEGHRIVSYFPLGEVEDGDLKKKIWLWTTIAGGSQPYDFDSFRVFIWSLRHHRYETSYIERKILGYAPVLLKEVDLSSGGKGKVQTAKYPGFSICLEKSDGQRYRREYALLGNLVRFAGEYSCQAPPPVFTLKAPAPLPGAAPAGLTAAPPPPTESLRERLKKRLRSLFGKK